MEQARNGAGAVDIRRLIDALIEIADIQSAESTLSATDVDLHGLLLQLTATRDGRDRWTPSVDLDLSDAPARWKADEAQLRKAIEDMLDWASGAERSTLIAHRTGGELEIALREHHRAMGAEQMEALNAALSGHGDALLQGVGLMLGLARAGLVASRHGGTGGARTLPDGGCEVFVRLPQDPAARVSESR